jgi:hypothetical protein
VKVIDRAKQRQRDHELAIQQWHRREAQGRQIVATAEAHIREEEAEAAAEKKDKPKEREGRGY